MNDIAPDNAPANAPAKPLALVLGATGGIGGEVARRLLGRGWRVRALNRNPARVPAGSTGIEWIVGDAMVAADVATAAQGARLIVHGVNPPGYADWERLVLPMLDNTIAAAQASGATIVLPGTVYNFGPDVFAAPITEDAPQNPRTVKGGIRVEMERRLQAAAGRNGVRVIIVRAGDFFGPTGASSWFSQGMVTPGKPLRSVTNPGRAGLGHQWAYLPDVAETMIRLVDKGTALPPFAVFHMDGVWDADGTQMVSAIRRASGNPRLRQKAFPWWLVPLASPFVTFLRELKEMRYLWKQPLRLHNARLVETLGAEPKTPIDTAVRDTLTAFGCITVERLSGAD